MSEWIPVTDRLPKFHETVLVTTKKEEDIAIGHFYKNPHSGDIMFDDHLSMFYYEYVSTDILAWMPLPKPYEAERKEEWCITQR